MYWRHNPKFNLKNGYLSADGKPVRDAWDEIATENTLTIGPLPSFFFPADTYILYLFVDPTDKQLFIKIAQGQEYPKCDRCIYRAGGEPCCEATTVEFEWFDEDGEYIGPEEYDPDTGWEDFPECECECECYVLPIFQQRNFIGGPGTIPLFWKNKLAHEKLVGATQYVVDDQNNLIITHMTVLEAYRRNRVNNFMIDYLVAKYPNKTLIFHDPTPDGSAFIDFYGRGEVWGKD